MTIQQLKDEIRANIYENANGRITGQILQDVLLDMVTKIDDAEDMAGRDGEDGIGIRNVTTASTSENDTEGVRVTLQLTDGRSTSFFLPNGRDGRDGANGRDGINGLNGADGSDGRDGRDGRNGADGQDGRTGAQGPKGAKGDRGEDGYEGPRGAQGPMGESGEGARGAQGPKGEDGARGAQGPAGSGGGSSTGSQGPQGQKGTKGDKGDKGDEGNRGAQGPAGYGDQGVFDALEEELNNYKSEVSGRLATISSVISSEAADAVAAALGRLNLTEESLAELRGALNQAAEDAQNALAQIRALSGITGGGEIDPEELLNALASIQQCHDWINSMSGGVSTILSDYDGTKAGLIGQGYNVAHGLFSWFGESIDVLSGTVGTVRRDMDGSQGLIRDIATWYDENQNSFTSAWTAIDAANARIDNVVEYVNDSAMTVVNARSYIDAKIAELGHEIAQSGADVTIITNKLNALSGTVIDQIDRQNGLSGSVVTIRRELNATSGSLVTSITTANSALTAANDMRDTWSEASGKLSTVANLVIMEDDEGIPEYYYIDPEDGESTRVYYQGKSGDGRTYFTSNQSGTGTKYFDNVYPKYMTTAFSYINQKANSIEMNVSSGDVMAALSLSATPDGSGIYMSADRILMDSEVFALALSAKTANLGRIKMGYGVISAGTGDTHWALTEDGTLYAQKGLFSGAVYATSLTLGDGFDTSTLIDDSGFIKVNEVIGDDTEMFEPSFSVSSAGALRAKNAVISGTVFATNGQFKGSISATNGYFKGSVSATNGYFKGSVSATNGYFAGTVQAADIILDGHSLKLTDSNDNSVLISNGEIEVDYVPKSYFMAAVSNQAMTFGTYNSTASFSKTCDFYVTGSTIMDIPGNSFTITGLTGSQVSLNVSACTFVYSANTSGVDWATDGLFDPNKVIMYRLLNQTTALASSISITCPTISGSYRETMVGGNNTMHTWGYWIRITGVANQTGRISAAQQVLNVVADASAIEGENKRFVRIGSNGMQIFLGKSFFFTCANVPDVGPTISLGGKVGGVVKYLKLDQNGFSQSGLLS